MWGSLVRQVLLGALLIGQFLSVDVRVLASEASDERVRAINALYRGEKENLDQFKNLLNDVVFSHPEVESAMAHQRGAVAQISEARAAQRTRWDVSVSGDFRLANSFEDSIDNFVERSRPNERINASLVGSRMLYDAGAAMYRVKSARASEESQRYMYRAIAGDVAFSALQAHLDVLRYQLLMNMAEQFKERHENYLSQLELRLASGAGAVREVARARARLMDISARSLLFERELASASAFYFEVHGARPSALKYPELGIHPMRNREMAFDLARTHSAELAVHQSRTDAAQHAYRSTRAEGFPQISAEVEGTKFNLDKSRNDFSVTGRLVIRYGLYTGGAQTAAKRSAFETYRAYMASKEAEERKIMRGVDGALSQLNILESQLPVLEEAFSANYISRQAFLDQFQATRGTFYDLLQAEESYFEASISYVNAMVDKDIASYAVLWRTGQLLEGLDIMVDPSDLRELP